MNRSFILGLINNERDRQDKKFPGQWTDPTWPEARKYLVLAEEFGEVAEALLEHEPVDNLRAELVQVAAVCVAWLEST